MQMFRGPLFDSWPSLGEVRRIGPTCDASKEKVIQHFDTQGLIGSKKSKARTAPRPAR
jgi:hypothetical protein